MKRAWVIVAPLLLAGCFPTTTTYTPRVSGTVLDASNNRPLVGARVSCLRGSHGAAPTVTDGEGHFILEQDRGYGVDLIGSERVPSGCDLHVEAEHYLPQSTALLGGDARVITLTLTPDHALR